MADASGKIDEVIPWHTNTNIGEDGDEANTTYYLDGAHLTDLGCEQAATGTGGALGGHRRPAAAGRRATNAPAGRGILATRKERWHLEGGHWLSALVGGLIGALALLLGAWGKYKGMVGEAKDKSLAAETRAKIDVQEQAMSAFQNMLAIAGEQSKEQRADFIAHQDKSIATFTTALRENQQFHREQVDGINGRVDVLAEAVAASVHRQTETSQQLEALARHTMANAEHLKAMREYIARESERENPTGRRQSGRRGNDPNPPRDAGARGPGDGDRP